MMKDQYNKLFWGIILATFHINLGMVRILPEFIGWWMVSSACCELYDISKNTKFMKARKVTGAIGHLVTCSIPAVTCLIRFRYGIGPSPVFTSAIYNDGNAVCCKYP